MIDFVYKVMGFTMHFLVGVWEIKTVSCVQF